jgi:hypothetical protein
LYVYRGNVNLIVIVGIKKGLIRKKDEEKDEGESNRYGPWHVYSIAP